MSKICRYMPSLICTNVQTYAKGNMQHYAGYMHYMDYILLMLVYAIREICKYMPLKICTNMQKKNANNVQKCQCPTIMPPILKYRNMQIYAKYGI